MGSIHTPNELEQHSYMGCTLSLKLESGEPARLSLSSEGLLPHVLDHSVPSSWVTAQLFFGLSFSHSVLV